MLIGVVGLNGSGKDTFANHLVKEYFFEHKDIGATIRDELVCLKRNHLDRTEMRALGNEKRKEFGFDYWAKLLIDSSKSNNLVITSIRHPSEVEYIVSKGGIIVEVATDIKRRYERTVKRVKSNSCAHGDVASFEEFKAKEDAELASSDPAKQQLLKCISMAEFRVDNNTSVGALNKKIDSLMEQLLKK